MKNHSKILFILLLSFCTAHVYGQGMDDDAKSINGDTITFMTYNIQKQSYRKNGKLIYDSGADVVAVQEIRGKANYRKITAETGMNGIRAITMGEGISFLEYGIALLWKPYLGTPAITRKTIHRRKGSSDGDTRRAYIIAEFNDFCFVATHYSTDRSDREAMSTAILAENAVQKCINLGKPVYIAGDLNEQIHEEPEAIDILTEGGFAILNNKERDESNRYMDKTTQGGRMIDLILEYNTNPKRETIYRGIPACSDSTFTISDHRPYVVKRIIK
jgi:endonuclease/exonuclease/phosphatase family metal-dependent hydrolase